MDLKGKAVKKLRLPTIDYSGSKVHVISAQQSDANSRYIEITLYDDNGDIDISGYTIIKLNATLPLTNSKKYVTGEIIENKIYCKLASGVLAEEGKVSADISLTSSSSSLSSQTFYIYVSKTQRDEDATEATDEII